MSLKPIILWLIFLLIPISTNATNNCIQIIDQSQYSANTITNLTNGDCAFTIIRNQNIQFYNLTIFLAFMTIGICLMWLMHVWEDNLGAAMSIGSFSFAIFLFMAVLIFRGFEIIHTSITLFSISVNGYIALVVLLLGMYNLFFAAGLYKYYRVKANPVKNDFEAN